jgi:YjbE family integral membrane protein
MLSTLLVLLSVIFIDIVLSGDNAVVVGIAANTLPLKYRNQAIMFGMGLAAAFRIVLSLVATQLLHYRVISIVGGFCLLWIVFTLVKDILTGEIDEKKGRESKGSDGDLWKTVLVVALADVSMSLDNVLVVAAVARNNPVILVLGLVVSIALVGFGAKLVSKLLESHKWMNWAGAGLVTLVAMELIFGVKAL